jgi:hypothetical protein
LGRKWAKSFGHLSHARYGPAVLVDLPAGERTEVKKEMKAPIGCGLSGLWIQKHKRMSLTHLVHLFISVLIRLM